MSLFLLGMWANIDSDRRLRELRKKPTEEKGDGVEKEKSGGNYKVTASPVGLGIVNG